MKALTEAGPILLSENSPTQMHTAKDISIAFTEKMLAIFRYQELPSDIDLISKNQKLLNSL